MRGKLGVMNLSKGLPNIGLKVLLLSLIHIIGLEHRSLLLLFNFRQHFKAIPGASLPATFEPSLSIRTPSPSRRLSLSSHQSPRQSWDCKIVKVNSRRGLGLTCAAGTRRGSRRCRSKAALHVFHLWGTNRIALNSMSRILSIS